MKKPTVTIGIPAYNEEGNIAILVKSLLNQNRKNYDLKTIVVNSDGSTDKTSQLIQEIAKRNRKVKLINNKVNKGVAYRQNEIIQKTNSDVLVLLNADVLPTSKNTIENLVKPLAENTVDMVCPIAIPLKGETFFEKVLYASVMFKNDFFETYNNGSNIFTCRGAARAFNKKMYKTLNFTQSLDEDAFSYLTCKTKGFRYSLVKQSGIYYKLPSNITDHENQSMRFFGPKTKLDKTFGKKNVKDSYKIPFTQLFRPYFKFLIRYPLYLSLYTVLSIYMKIKSANYDSSKDSWSIAKSSKTLIVNL